MAFASAWLREKALFQQFISETPHPGTGIIVVVPAYNEPGITSMLDSLTACTRPGCETEVIIVINAPPDAPEKHREGNRLATEKIERWKKQNEDYFFRLFIIEPWVSFPDWGVGLARKTGMDEALRRFDAIDKPCGVILCLDADCTVKQDYLASVSCELLERKDRNACSVYFEHPLSGSEYPGSHYRSITLYELHLRYYYQGLKYSGFPYAFQTTGSAMAVKALAYMKAGGMNRKQAGEDFYFIQKLAPSDGYFYLNSTAVYPAPRTSYRVPFGTGASMEKLTREAETEYLTYNFQAFRELKTTFGMTEYFFGPESDKLNDAYGKLPQGIKMFIGEDEWRGKILEIRNNTRGFQSFRKRFFGWFNMFKTVKYLNFVHQDVMKKIPVEKAAAELLRHTEINSGLSNAGELLDLYRSLERGF